MPVDAAHLPLFEQTRDLEPRRLPEGVVEARRAITAAATELLAIPEAALTKLWAWRADSEEEVRYAAYRSAEALEQAEIEIRTRLAPHEATESRAARIVAPATAARWDLHGLLLPLDDAALDDDPPGDEWSIRLVLGHVINGQRAYGWSTAWWQAHPHRPDDPELPRQIPDPFWHSLPDEATSEAAGSMAEVRARLDDVLDRSAERLAGMPDERTELGARWAGFAITVGFRLGRWGSHIREHAIQVEKTLVMLGRTPTEPERLVRHVLAAYGRAESALFARARAVDAVEPLLAAVDETRRVIGAARKAARA